MTSNFLDKIGPGSGRFWQIRDDSVKAGYAIDRLADLLDIL